ncbi:hypothetical protein [Streptomyces sp. NPDC048659]|uniref:hypothetical protein n=1 Tax=Streptomyces sp. NPDC048659 TaxID=3155489 RepID=UPI00343AC030
MGESVRVRCPECLRTQRYAPPAFPCACGTPITPPVLDDAPAEQVTHRNWSEEWVTVLCPTCARPSDWPHPELGCACGAVLRVAVRGSDPHAPRAADAPHAPPVTPAAPPATSAAPAAQITPAIPTAPATPAIPTTPTTPTTPAVPPEIPDTVTPPRTPEPPAPPAPPAPATTGPLPGPVPTPGPAPDTYPAFAQRHPAQPDAPLGGGPGDGPGSFPAARPAFRPVTIRTARDAVAASAGYLRWLGFRDVVQPEERSATAVDLRGPGLVAQVDPSTRPTGLRAVECLWLNGLSNGAAGICFSLAGYTPEAHERAEGLGIPLFVLDLTGTPQPVNGPADALIATGAA